MQRANHFAQTTDVKYPLTQKVASANDALLRVASLVMMSNDTMQWDDFNHTDTPVLTFDLTAGTSDYFLYQDEQLNQIYKVFSVLVKQADGTYQEIPQVDYEDRSAGSILAKDISTGLPTKYDIFGNTIYFDAAPTADNVDGVRILFQREASYFNVADTIKEPGFISAFHKLIPLWMAYDYTLAKSTSQSVALRNEIDRMEADLAKFYSGRSRTNALRITARQGNYE